MMRRLIIPAGGQLMLGAPANSMPAEKSMAIAGVLRGIADVIEAHLPQAFAPGAMDAPAQILVMVLKDGAASEEILQKLDDDLKEVFAEGEFVDVMAISKNSDLIDEIRSCDCRIK